MKAEGDCGVAITSGTTTEPTPGGGGSEAARGHRIESWTPLEGAREERPRENWTRALSTARDQAPVASALVAGDSSTASEGMQSPDSSADFATSRLDVPTSCIWRPLRPPEGGTFSTAGSKISPAAAVAPAAAHSLRRVSPEKFEESSAPPARR